tara:strand:+ start:163 stop:381 length:219 start_codon:yes stop_codon:yes gene_type:complete
LTGFEKVILPPGTCTAWTWVDRETSRGRTRSGRRSGRRCGRGNDRGRVIALLKDLKECFCMGFIALIRRLIK